MTMSPGLRKVALTAHIVFSVGWFGAVAGFLALAIVGLTSEDTQMARATYLATDLTATFVIVPLSFAALLTGLILSLGTKWGLFRHYWILAKFVITALSILILLVHLQPIRFMADAAAEMTWVSADLRPAQMQLVAAPAASLLAMLVTIALAVHKPRGMTPFGQRKA